MPTPFDESSFSRLVHEPARLAILTALSACDTADFLFLRTLTGLTAGNLSGHLAKLEDANLVAIEKSFKGKSPRTAIRLTKAGRSSIRRHWDQLTALQAAARRWRVKGRLDPERG